METTYSLHLSFENTRLLKEAQNTDFGFGQSNKSGVIRLENKIIGFFNACDYGLGVKLQELEILDDYRNQGYGKQFIKELFHMYPDCEEIHGESIEDAKGFYYSIGAYLEDSCSTICPNVDCIHNIDFNEEVSEDTCDDYCDNYNENIFHIYRDNFLN